MVLLIYSWIVPVCRCTCIICDHFYYIVVATGFNLCITDFVGVYYCFIPSYDFETHNHISLENMIPLPLQGGNYIELAIVPQGVALS